MIYIIAGCGLLGSNIAVMTPYWDVLLIDNDSFDKKHKILPCYYSNELKVNAIAKYRKKHSMKKQIGAIPLRFEELGDGFMSWCASNGGVIIDATDGLNSSRNIGQIAHKFNLPVITGKVSGNKGIVRVFPGKDSIYFCCLGLVGKSKYKSCFGLPTSESIPATNASLSVASVVSALMITNTENVCSAEKAYEIRVDLDKNNFQMVNLNGVTPCQRLKNQQDDEIEIFSIESNSYELKIIDLILKAQKICNESDMKLELPFPLARSFICSECKKIQEVYRFIGARLFKCDICGGEMLVQQNSLWDKNQAITLEDARQMNGNLYDLGLPLWHKYKLYNKNCQIELEVSNDKCLLIGA